MLYVLTVIPLMHSKSVAVFTALTLLVSYYAVFHLAANARFIFRRTMYYLFG